MPRIVPETAAVTILRDVSDLALLTCAHYLRLGAARVLVIDDGSTDGTHEQLTRLARRSQGRLRIQRVIEPAYLQPQLMTAAVNGLIEEGFRLIIPFDADEFWHLDAATLARLVADRRPRTIAGHWLNFVQQRGRHAPSPFGLLGIRHRAPPAEGDIREAVLAFAEPFVRAVADKVMFWSDVPVSLDRGQHSLPDGPEAVDPLRPEIFHIPLRYRSEIAKRGFNYEPRRVSTRLHASHSWQSAFHRAVMHQGRLDEVWAANSAGPDQCLDVYGRAMPLIPDLRLRRLLLAAGFHLACRYRLFPAMPKAGEARPQTQKTPGIAARGSL